jgi:hypothetical protein
VDDEGKFGVQPGIGDLRVALEIRRAVRGDELGLRVQVGEGGRERGEGGGGQRFV